MSGLRRIFSVATCWVHDADLPAHYGHIIHIAWHLRQLLAVDQIPFLNVIKEVK